MDVTYWHKQTASQPLFPDLAWSRPETKSAAGRLLIIGGNQYGFVEPADAFAAAEAAGVGVARMVLPDSLRQYVGKVFTAGELAPSTPSGSFSQMALGTFINEASWADGVLLAGGLGRNSETAIVLEKFLSKHTGQVTITKDAVDYCTSAPQNVLQRLDTTLVLSFSQLQKLAIASHTTTAITYDMDFLRLIETLHDFTSQHTVNLITKHHDSIFVACNGEVSSTKLTVDKEVWRVNTAAAASVWWLQNPTSTFQALSASLA